MLKRIFSFATLFFSISTLICCALPALFVAIGAGAAFVSVLGTVPQLVWFSEHKVLIFSIAGALLLSNIAMRLVLPQQCPADPKLASECARTRKISNIVLIISVVAFLIGAFFAFIAPSLLS